MAKINSAQHEVAATETAAAALAFLGFVCCMVVTLMGIKIWWFKHRLSFDQSSTSNGAVGGAQPQIVTRTRSSKDKRLTQQIREPVVVHGVFRKRQEDEIETFERPKQLPPIRESKLSQSTPELFRKPTDLSLKAVSASQYIDIPAPPTREPPPPPIRNAPKPPLRKTTSASQQRSPITPHIQRSPTPPIFEDVTITTPSLNSTSLNKEEYKPKTFEVHSSPIPRSPTSPIFEEIDTKTTFKSTSFGSDSDMKINEFYSSDEEVELRDNEFKRVETKSKDEELPIRAPRPLQRNRSHNLEAVERRFLRARNTSFDKTKPRAHLMERRATGIERPDQLEWQQFHGDDNDDIDTDSISGYGREKGKLRKWEDLQSYSEENLEIEHSHFGKQQFNGKKVVIQVVDEIDGVNGEYEKDLVHNSIWEPLRRPTGYPYEAPRLLTDLNSEGDDRSHAQSHLCFDESNKIWLEMERDLDSDFASNVEEEFNKIRHSYEANEEGFLEESTNELDTGYGKSIDEDWENFEKLEQNDNKNVPSKEKSNTHIKGTDVMESVSWMDNTTPQQKVHFNLKNEDQKKIDGEAKETSVQIRERRPTGFERNSLEIQTAILEEQNRDLVTGRTHKVSFHLSDEQEFEESEEDNETSLIKQRRPTGFERNSLEIQTAILEEQNRNSVTGRTHKVSFQLSDEQEFEENKEDNETSLIKERRPTGYTNREDFNSLQLERNNDEEKKADLVSLEPDGPIQPKPRRQKVTFNFTTQVREHEIDDDDDEEDVVENQNNSKQPTPMQRMSTPQLRSENTAALLFSTQVSAEYASADEGFSDSWSAIRLHRQLTDEFQQLTLEEEEKKIKETPKPGFRNPLAQVDADDRRDEHTIVAKPRTMRDMKKAQARQTMQVQHFDGSATEA